MANKIQPGSRVILMPWVEGAPEFEAEARSNVVNSTVQFKFGTMYEWVHVSRIVRVLG